MSILQRILGRHPVRLDGRTVVITGGGRGIGAATAQLAAARGATVWIGDIDLDVATETANRLDNTNAAYLDVTDAQSWRQFLDGVGRTPDILVNNAGVMPLGAFESEGEATTDLILDVNVRGVLNGIRAVTPDMVARGHGHIVNIASMAGMIPLPGMVSYNASKFAVLGASRAARREYHGTGVTVSAILPAAVRTELASGAELGGALPTVDPGDVADAVLDTLRTTAAATSVPRWVRPGWSLVDAFVPEAVENWARGMINDRRGLNAIDAHQRRAYTDRIDRQSKDHVSEDLR